MASPTVNARTNTATGLSVNLGSPVAGELVIVFSTFGPVSGVASQPSVDTAASGNGWHLIGKANTNNGAGTSVCTVYIKIAAGSDVLTFRASQNGNYSHICYRITGHGSAVTVASATGSSTTADPPNCAQSGSAQDALALAFAGVTSSTAPSGAPAGYGTLTTQAGSVFGASLGVAEKALTSVSSENPGAFTNANQTWAAFTCLVASTAITTNERTTSEVVEVLSANALKLVSTQLVAEVLSTQEKNLYLTQLCAEVISKEASANVPKPFVQVAS